MRQRLISRLRTLMSHKHEAGWRHGRARPWHSFVRELLDRASSACAAHIRTVRSGDTALRARVEVLLADGVAIEGRLETGGGNAGKPFRPRERHRRHGSARAPTRGRGV
jgi:hypothetical protein